jgi:hypothetical protein
MLSPKFETIFEHGPSQPTIQSKKNHDYPPISKVCSQKYALKSIFSLSFFEGDITLWEKWALQSVLIYLIIGNQNFLSPLNPTSQENKNNNALYQHWTQKFRVSLAPPIPK